jgi:hypothetical protein
MAIVVARRKRAAILDRIIEVIHSVRANDCAESMWVALSVLPCPVRMDPLPVVEVDVDLGLLELFRAGLSIMIYRLRFLVFGLVAIFCAYVTSIIQSYMTSSPRLQNRLNSGPSMRYWAQCLR